GWLHTLRLHKYTSNFEGMAWKEMVVVMDEQALEAQGVAALGVQTFEVVRRKVAPPPPLSGGPAHRARLWKTRLAVVVGLFSHHSHGPDRSGPTTKFELRSEHTFSLA
ncbi:hypothetical protein EDB85DRAFT_1865932, partial [Lactarius pseudohatsudake]